LSTNGREFSFITTFVRPNISYIIMDKSKPKFENLLAELKEKYPTGSGIIYCLSR